MDEEFRRIYAYLHDRLRDPALSHMQGFTIGAMFAALSEVETRLRKDFDPEATP